MRRSAFWKVARGDSLAKLGTLDRFQADGQLLEKAVQLHIVPDAAIAAGELLGQAVEVATLGGGTLAIDGTSGAIFLIPVQVSVTEIDGQMLGEQNSVATPISGVVVEASQDFLAGTARTATPVEQEPLGVATVIETDIGADNGVIHAGRRDRARPVAGLFLLA